MTHACNKLKTYICNVYTGCKRGSNGHGSTTMSRYAVKPFINILEHASNTESAAFTNLLSAYWHPVEYYIIFRV